MAWLVELSQFDITFKPRGPIKAQCLVDFVNELHPYGHFEEQWWTLHVDGSSNCRGSGASVILEGPKGIVLEQSLRFRFKASNNQAEYEALLARLRLAEDMGASRVKCLTDSKVMAEQVGDNFQVKNHNMMKYYHAYQKLKTNFQEVSVEHIPREDNTRAGQLARLVATKKSGHLRTIIQQEIDHPSVDAEVVANVNADRDDQDDSQDWRAEIRAFLINGTTPTDPTEAKRLRTQANRYVVIAGQLYKRGFSTPLLKCLNSVEADYVTREVHEEMPTRSETWQLDSSTGRAATLHSSSMVIRHLGGRHTRTLPSCQGTMQIPHRRRGSIHQMDRSRAPGMYLGSSSPEISMEEYHHPIRCPTHPDDRQRPSIYRPEINEFLNGLGIQHKVTSVEHPQTNGQAESANKVILAELKKLLGEAKGSWAEQLPEVLWAYRCTPQSTTQETPFRLVYGSDAMIPVEIGEPSFRRAHYDESNNEVELRVNLNTAEDVRDRAQVVAEATKQRYKRRFDSKVKPREFREGDLVWRATGEARKDLRHGKLAPNWDGPFRIRHNLNNGAYKLEHLSGEPIPRTWNSSHLKMYYS
ncbi:uncharacterized protein LOC109811704 [Cajanus cajan]|uniref:uncharacterized protein LOC109811704 n=1 Tax=Cajanus cajan TaxID=3821 RepID=UPI00098DC4C6|nr:uncharacterized protein LOC109811704 [Cajanus cajan]